MSFLKLYTSVKYFIAYKIKNTRFETNSAHEGGAVVLWQNSWGDHRVEFD